MELSSEDRRTYDRIAKQTLEKAGLRTPPYDLFRIADELGVEVVIDWDDAAVDDFRLNWNRPEENRLGLTLTASPEGVFVFDESGLRRIRLRPGMRQHKGRVVFAHELAHAILEHDAFLLYSPHQTSVDALELAAQYLGHQLVTGVDTFARAVESAAGASVPTKWLVLDVSRMFQISSYVALRSYAEHAKNSVAVVSLIVLHDGKVKVVGHSSKDWLGLPFDEVLPRDNPLAFRAVQLVNNPLNSGRARDVVDHAALRYSANRVEFHVSQQAVHLLMHR